jgi:hypothetical protein
MAWVKAQEEKELDVALGMAQKAKSQMSDPSISDTLAWVIYKKIENAPSSKQMVRRLNPLSRA